MNRVLIGLLSSVILSGCVESARKYEIINNPAIPAMVQQKLLPVSESAIISECNKIGSSMNDMVTTSKYMKAVWGKDYPCTNWDKIKQQKTNIKTMVDKCDRYIGDFNNKNDEYVKADTSWAHCYRNDEFADDNIWEKSACIETAEKERERLKNVINNMPKDTLKNYSWVSGLEIYRNTYSDILSAVSENISNLCDEKYKPLLQTKSCDYSAPKTGCLVNIGNADYVTMSVADGVIVNDGLFVYTTDKYYDGQSFNNGGYHYQYNGLKKIGVRTLPAFRRSAIKDFYQE